MAMGSATVQGDIWGAQAEDWAYRAEPTTEPLWRAVLRAAEVRPGIRLLDVGCGGGGLAVLGARLGAEVQGLDASPALIEIARRRVPEGVFQVGDIESLPYPDKAFDAVIACNSLQFADDQLQAAREARRVLKEDGKLGVGMWCEPDRCEMRTVFAAIGALAGDRPPGSPQGPPSLTVRENLVGLLELAGLRVDAVEEVECTFLFADIEEALRALQSPGMIVAMARKVGQERVRDAILGAIRGFVQGDGSVRMSNWFRHALCRR